MRKGREGFTLVELLIVVVIIGILAAIAIPRFGRTQEKALYAALKMDLANLRTQQELYHAEHYAYAAKIADLEFSASEGVTISMTPEDEGWSARALHKDLGSDKGCAIFFGDVGTKPTVGGTTADKEGIPACTD